MTPPYVKYRDDGDAIESTTTFLRRVGDRPVMWGRDDGGEETFIPLASSARRRRPSWLADVMEKRERDGALRAAELQKLTCRRRGAQ